MTSRIAGRSQEIGSEGSGVSRGFIVAGTDTGIGKTVFAAGLVGALDGVYWKPVQAGLADETDSATVARFCGLPPSRILPEAYRLDLPASPHLGAAREGLTIERARLSRAAPQGRALVIEAAGGLMVPLARDLLQIDVMADWGLPVIVCARTSLGTINHTLLSIEALRRRGVMLRGVAFIGLPDDDAERAIVDFGEVARLGRLPLLDPLTGDNLRLAFRDSFDVAALAAEAAA